MQRLVYNPRIDVFIKADDGVYDISPYVVSCVVNRKVDQVSSAQVQFRNPKLMFTEHTYRDPVSKEKITGPVFHPQDPIIITLTRLRDRPIQVFTGYCDTTPYMSLYPGVVGIDASCTLKRLMYTYWDPGLPFVWEWLRDHGWQTNTKMQGLTNFDNEGDHKAQGQDTDGVDSNDVPSDEPDQDLKLTDSGISQLLFDFMTEIGGWEEKDIYIERLPPAIVPLVAQMYEMFKDESAQSSKELQDLLTKIIGTSSPGSGSGSGGTVSGTSGTIVGLSSAYNEFSNAVAQSTGIPLRVMGAWCCAEGGPEDNPLNIGPGNSYGTPQKAAEATVNLLKTGPSLIHAILTTAEKGGSDQDIMKAILGGNTIGGGYVSGSWGTVGDAIFHCYDDHPVKEPKPKSPPKNI